MRLELIRTGVVLVRHRVIGPALEDDARVVVRLRKLAVLLDRVLEGAQRRLEPVRLQVDPTFEHVVLGRLREPGDGRLDLAQGEVELPDLERLRRLVVCEPGVDVVDAVLRILPHLLAMLRGSGAAGERERDERKSQAETSSREHTDLQFARTVQVSGRRRAPSR
jgi:hypothetical protein